MRPVPGSWCSIPIAGGALVTGVWHVAMEGAQDLLATFYDETKLSQVSSACHLELLPDLGTQLQFFLQDTEPRQGSVQYRMVTMVESTGDSPDQVWYCKSRVGSDHDSFARA